MKRAIIIGSGPAAAGAALALTRTAACQVHVIDVGNQLEPANQAAVQSLASVPPGDWDEADVALVRTQPVQVKGRALPQKRAYGSDFPFRDVGQLTGVQAGPQTNEHVISGAYGGLSNVWGSQIMPFSDATFTQWPIRSDEMRRHYGAILSQIPFAGEMDDLAHRFPLIADATPLPELAPRGQKVLAAYHQHRARLSGIGVVVGKARLALSSGSCVRCGLCMTGCPYGLIYSAAHTFDQLRSRGQVVYSGGLLAVRLGEDERGPYVLANRLGTDRTERLDADRIFVACGAMGSTRLVLGSLDLFDRPVEMAESAQFVLPVLSRRSEPDPRNRSEFTLNQFNMTVELDDVGLDISQIHFYPYNPAIVDALPSLLRRRGAAPLTDQLLSRLTVGLGYLPSWASPRLTVSITPPPNRHGLPEMQVRGLPARMTRTPMFRQVVQRLFRAAPYLDLWPVLPLAYFSDGAKSYHYGGSFPHASTPADHRLETDRLGRLRAWSRIHLVDASVFPTVPATTFTLTIMANAHRIATEVSATLDE